MSYVAETPFVTEARIGRAGSGVVRAGRRFAVEGLLRGCVYAERMKRSEATKRIEGLLERVASGQGKYLPRVREVWTIAARVFLTERGVEKHVTSIFQKLRLPVAADTHRRVLAVVAFLQS
jgi:hypothetical protein